MQKRNQESQIYKEVEIDLRAIFNSLVARRFFILGLTAFITIIAAVYEQHLSSTFTPTYQANVLFTKPSSKSLHNINNLIYTEETKNSVFSSFLIVLSSQKLQKEVFVENDFLTKFNKDNRPIDDVNGFIEGAINSITIERPKLDREELGLYFNEKPYSISMNGDDDNVISNYLDALIEGANSKTITEILELNQDKISMRLDQIAIDTEMLFKKYRQNRLNQINRITEEDGQKLREINDQIEALKIKAKQDRLNQIDRIMEEDGQKLREINDQIEALKIKAKQDRLNQIDRIMEEDGQKLREINDKIARARFEAKESRLNQIKVLTASAKLAKSLGIIENNFKMINNNESDSDLTIAISENKDLPEWYLYGERALLQRIKILGSRNNDDPFIPELVTLKNQINEIQNNNLLKTLKARQDDSPFIPELVALKNQINEIQNNNLLKTLKARQDDSPFIPELVALKNQINEIQNNNLLKTLKARQDDSPFIPELVALNLEKDRLDESTNLNLSNTKPISISGSAKVESTSRNKNLIVLLAFIGSFIISIFLALIMNALKPDESNPT